MSWKLFLIFLSVPSAWGMSNVYRECIATFSEDLNNNFLVGTWYHVVRFTLFGNMVPSGECPTFEYQKPNSTELQRYKDEYLTADIPYSFDDNPLEEMRMDWVLRGLLIGNKQAKFYIMNPSSAFRRPEYEVMVYQRINDNYVAFHACDLRGNISWLMSRNRNPPEDEIDEIIKSRPDLVRMSRQRYCARN